MDRLVYTAMSGAKQTMLRQDTIANNLANANTTGFRADMVAFRAVPARGQEAGTRVFVVETTTGSDFAPGPMQSTGRDLDVAVQGSGFIAVQGADGSEAYTRNGAFETDPQGQLQLASGALVLSDSGPIQIPPGAKVSIGSDGIVSVKTQGSAAVNSVGRIKLVNADTSNLVKSTDGLFRTRTGDPADTDPNVKLASGTLEGSNVNVIEAVVSMISTARQFEMQMKLLSTAEQNEQKAGTVIAN